MIDLLKYFVKTKLGESEVYRYGSLPDSYQLRVSIEKNGDDRYELSHTRIIGGMMMGNTFRYNNINDLNEKLSEILCDKIREDNINIIIE